MKKRFAILLAAVMLLSACSGTAPEGISSSGQPGKSESGTVSASPSGGASQRAYQPPFVV